jgi:2-dehydro-3-deoxyphosphogluconate aldolase/(4S)-4-hydroxy-2-oxoglutarate aldolase
MKDSSAYNELAEQLESIAVIPVIAIPDPDLAEPLAHALMDGGIPVIEITYRTPAAAESIRRITRSVPDMLVGAGTVLTLDQVREARDVGASFIVTPGFSATVVTECLSSRLPVFPGVATPTEVTRALENGLSILKFFPAGAMGGPAMLKALSGPFQSTRFIPTGGVHAENLADYLILPQVLACGGSWLAHKDDIREGKFDLITEKAQEARQIVAHLRGRREVS